MCSADPLSIQRGNYAWTLPGPLLLILGRLACIPLQHLILSINIFNAPRSSTAVPNLSFWPSSFPIPPAPEHVFLGITGVLVLKQAIWAFYISREHMSIRFALFGVIADFFYEGISALVFSCALLNPTWRPEFLYVGAAVHAAAAAVELAAELQRKRFKDDPGNRGRLCTSGPWGVVRHPNFAMNVLYGAAYGFATGGLLFVGFPVAMYVGNFVTNAIPPKETYLKGKYGEQWERYKRVVRWKLCPGVY
jgi:protein-S-isoprenylcysteine O-methyltransferase Ste14